MNTLSVISPKQSVSFRWNADLVNHLKEMAKRQNRSLSNFTETILSRFMEETDAPNEATKASLHQQFPKGQLFQIFLFQQKMYILYQGNLEVGKKRT